MSITRTSLSAVIVTAAALALAIAPAQADNPVLSHHGVSAKYVDRTDQLCARTNDSGTYAEAVIMSGSRILFRKIDSTADGKWACTANLSIAEDQRYDLSVLSCIKTAQYCVGKRTAFFS